MSVGAPRPLLRRAFHFAAAFASRHPFSVALAITVLATGAALTAPRTAAVRVLAAGPLTTAHEHLWWTPITALLVPGSLLDAVLSAALALTVLAYVEHLLGTARTVLAFFGVGAVAILVGIGVHMLTIWLGMPVFLLAVPSLTLDPATGMFGAIMAGSAAAPVLFRRRIRIIGFAVALTFALYGGSQDSIYRLIAAVLGLALGAILHRSRPRREPTPPHPGVLAVTAAVRRGATFGEARTLVAAVVAVTGVGPVIVLLGRTVYGPLALVVSGYAQFDRSESFERCAGYFSSDCAGGAIHPVARGVSAVLLALLPVVLSLIAAWGLRTGRRSAWILAVLVTALSLGVTAVGVGFAGLLSVQGLERVGERFAVAAMLAVGVPLAVLVMLVLTRRRFTLRAAPAAVRTFWATVGIAAAIVAVVWAVVFAVTGTLTVPLDLREIVRHILGVTLPPRLTRRIGHTFAADLVPTLITEWVGVAFWAAVVVALIRLLRAAGAHVESADDVRFRTLLRTPGAGTLSFMGTWAGNSHWVGADGRGAVAYRRQGAVALVVADPVCAPEDLGAVVDGFLAFCDERALIPVFYSIHDDTLAVLRVRGWDRLPVGEETVVVLPGLDLAGSRWKRVRQALAKGEREGLRTIWTRWDELTPSMASQIEALSEHWVAEKALPEMGFTLGGVAELRDPDVALLLAVDGEDRLQAVTSWLPGWRDGVIVSWTLDFMRRDDDAIAEIMVYLIASAALLMRDAGVMEMSLSGAPLATKPDAAPTRDAADASGASVLVRLLGWLGEVLEPVYGFRSLFAFKRKFHPELRTIWMAYADAADLLTIGRAIGRAYLPSASPAQVVDLLRMLSAGHD